MTGAAHTRRSIRLHPRRGRPCGWGLLETVPWNPSGRFHADAIDPGTRLDCHTGCTWPQDAASQLPVILLDPRPGETVVDACAAPGSKTTQIGLALGDDGLLIACDPAPARRAVLAGSLARQGVACALVTPMPLEALARRAPGCADAVLVDAPCSGQAERAEGSVARLVRLQGRILAAAANLVRPGGRLVYSTCTAREVEDEDVVADFLAHHAGWRVEPRSLPGCRNGLTRPGGLRVAPEDHGTEPFFAVLLHRDAAGPVSTLQGDLPGPVNLPGDLTVRSGWTLWRRGPLLLAGSPQAAACALPAEARGLILGRSAADGRFQLDTWGAQGLIERGADHATVPHALACTLWAGEPLPAAGRSGGLLATDQGAPLGVLDGDGQRLLMPSRMRRTELA